MWSRSAMSACLVLAVQACAAGDIGPIDTSSRIELGTGESEFVSLEEDAPLEVVLGTQGGYHVVGNARIRGFVPGPVLGEQPDGMHFEVTAFDGARLNLDSGEIHTGLAAQPDGSFTCLPGHHVLVEGEAQDLDGLPALFSVEMDGADGELMTDSRRVFLTFSGP